MIALLQMRVLTQSAVDPINYYFAVGVLTREFGGEARAQIQYR